LILGGCNLRSDHHHETGEFSGIRSLRYREDDLVLTDCRIIFSTLTPGLLTAASAGTA
jgi:hypothetical protein